MTEIRGIDPLTFGGKLPPRHSEGYVELARYQFGCNWKELAENIVPMNIP
jgi:hypothetical protein